MYARSLPNAVDLPSPADLFGGLPIQQIRCQVVLPSDANLPPFAGSAWRGLIGWELQRLVCPFDRRPACTACTIQDHCPYFLLLEKKSNVSGLRESPKGYVFHSPFDSQGSSKRELHITLFGFCTRFLPVVAKAVFRGRRSGIGAGRWPYEVVSWEEVLPDRTGVALPLDSEGYREARGPFPLRDWLASVSVGKSVERVRFTSPVRLRRQGNYLNRMDWPFFFGSLVRRLEALHCIFHDGDLLGKERWLALQAGFSTINGIADRLRWYDLKRYSNRQRRKVPMGGLFGDVDLNDSPAWLAAWWRAAAVVHVGKGVSMGLGKVKILEK